MTTLTIAIKTGKKHMTYFFIEFETANIDKVLDAVEKLETVEDVCNNPLWKVKM